MGRSGLACRTASLAACVHSSLELEEVEMALRLFKQARLWAGWELCHSHAAVAVVVLKCSTAFSPLQGGGKQSEEPGSEK